MTSISNYLSGGIHGALLFVDWLMFIMYAVGSVGMIVMLVANPIAKIRNPLLLVLHYVHIVIFIGILALLVHILFRDSSLAWLPPMLLWVQFIAMMTQEGMKARASKGQSISERDKSYVDHHGRLESEDRTRVNQLRGTLPTGQHDLENGRVLKLGIQALSLMFKARRKSSPRVNPLAIRRTADVLSTPNVIADPRLAVPLYREAVVATRQKWGGQHFRTAEALEKLADLIKRDGSAETESLYREAVAIREAVQGPGHADTIISANKLALYLSAQRELRNGVGIDLTK